MYSNSLLVANLTDTEIARWQHICGKRFDYLEVGDYATAQMVCPQTLALYGRLCIECRTRQLNNTWMRET